MSSSLCGIDHDFRVALPHSVSNRSGPVVIIRSMMLLPPPLSSLSLVVRLASVACRLIPILRDGSSSSVIRFTCQFLDRVAVAACKPGCLTIENDK